MHAYDHNFCYNELIHLHFVQVSRVGIPYAVCQADLDPCQNPLLP